MSFNISFSSIYIAILITLLLYLLWKFFKEAIFPGVADKFSKEIEVNPKWIISELRNKYYGFQDIDIILVEDRLRPLPRMRVTKEERYELLIPKNVSTDDIETVAQIALAVKIRAKYGIIIPDKPTYWLSVLCYMLDGGNIRQEAISWKDIDSKKDNKPIDDI